MKLLSSLVVLAVSISSSPARSQCAAWTEGFAPGGLGGSVDAMVTFDDGSGPRLYAGGQFTEANGVLSGHVARWDGTQWEPLASQLSGNVRALVVYDAGVGAKLYAGGTNVLPGADLAAWDGASWTPIASGPNGDVLALEVFDGWLYIGGTFPGDGPAVSPNVTRWNGTIWAGIGGTSGTVGALKVHDDGSGPALYVGGDFNLAGGLSAPGVARFNGGAWSAVGAGTTAAVLALAVHDFGAGPELVSGGQFTSARWNGAAWTTMPGLSLAGGWSSRALVSTGSDLFTGGAFGVVGAGTAGANVARWNGSSWSAVGAGLQGSWVNTLAVFDDGSGAKVFAGGQVQSSGAVHVANAARWDGVSWSPAGRSNGIHGWGVEAIATFDDGTGEALYVAGEFAGAGELVVSSIARRQGSTWTSIGEVAGVVRALMVFDDGFGPKLYAAGSFTSIGGVPAKSIARWDGSAWSFPLSGGVQLGPEPYFSSLVAHDDGSGPALYAAGEIPVVPGVGSGWRPFALRWREHAWSFVGAWAEFGYGGQAHALVVHDDGSGPALYTGGYALRTEFVNHGQIAKWDGVSWSGVGSGLTFPGNTPTCRALASIDDGTGAALYAGGTFSTAGGAPASNVARWANGAWSALGDGVNGEVLSLANFDEGTGAGPSLHAGGAFTLSGAASVPRIARWQDGAWSAVDGGIQGTSTHVAVYDLFATTEAGERVLYAGGTFDDAGAYASQRLARFVACDETGATYCYGDGTATACPCGNASAIGGRAGCLNSLATGGTIRARGEPSLSNDTLSLDGGGMTNSSALYFQGANVTNGGAGLVFGDGLRCVNGPYVRLLAKVNVGGASTYPEAGNPSVSVKGLITAPGTRHYQVRYRNAAVFCTTDTFNYTNAVEVVWTL